VQEFFQGLICKQKLMKVNVIEVFKGAQGGTNLKGDKGQIHPAEVKFIRENLGSIRRNRQGGSNSGNSLWRICEAARTIGSRGVAKG
jgi:hypothetical protein